MEVVQAQAQQEQRLILVVKGVKVLTVVAVEAVEVALLVQLEAEAGMVVMD